ncbi:hypothetical protein SGPA1_40881 [Streptomyces misionensis JCM 4497]
MRWAGRSTGSCRPTRSCGRSPRHTSTRPERRRSPICPPCAWATPSSTTATRAAPSGPPTASRSATSSPRLPPSRTSWTPSASAGSSPPARCGWPPAPTTTSCRTARPGSSPWTGAARAPTSRTSRWSCRTSSARCSTTSGHCSPTRTRPCPGSPTGWPASPPRRTARRCRSSPEPLPRGTPDTARPPRRRRGRPAGRRRRPAGPATARTGSRRRPRRGVGRRTRHPRRKRHPDQLVFQGPVRPAHRDRLGTPAAGARLRVGHDLLAPPSAKRGRLRRRPDVVRGDRGYDHDKYRRLVRDLGVKPLIARRRTDSMAQGSVPGAGSWSARSPTCTGSAACGSAGRYATTPTKPSSPSDAHSSAGDA